MENQWSFLYRECMAWSSFDKTQGVKRASNFSRWMNLLFFALWWSCEFCSHLEWLVFRQDLNKWEMGSSNVMQYLSTTGEIMSHPKALIGSSSPNAVETSEEHISMLLMCLSMNGRPLALGNAKGLLMNIELKNSLNTSAWVAESITVIKFWVTATIVDWPDLWSFKYP